MAISGAQCIVGLVAGQEVDGMSDYRLQQDSDVEGIEGRLLLVCDHNAACLAVSCRRPAELLLVSSLSARARFSLKLFISFLFNKPCVETVWKRVIAFRKSLAGDLMNGLSVAIHHQQAES